MESKVVHLSREEIIETLDTSAADGDPKKVYYEYVTDTVEENLPAEKVAETLQWLRTQYEDHRAIHGLFDVAQFKTLLRTNHPHIDRFAREHPRFFDNTLSHHTRESDLEVMRQMLKFRAAVESGTLAEPHARALLNEILIKHNARPITGKSAAADREKMADERLARKVVEGSYLGFDPKNIPALREAAEQLKREAV